MKLLKHIKVDFKNNLIIFKYQGSDDIIYKTQKNQFIENSGLTIKNPEVGIKAYLLPLNEWGSSLICGHIIDNIAGLLQKNKLENIILFVDFNGITQISKSFCEEYFKFMLTTPSKVININMNTNINNTFVSYIDSVVEYQEEV